MSIASAELIMGLEGSEGKQQVRNEIAGQDLEFFGKIRRRDSLLIGKSNLDVKGLTLPGISYEFENQLTRKYHRLLDGTISFDCFEKSAEVYPFTESNRPVNCALYRGSLANLRKFLYDFIWADYCGAATRKTIAATVALVLPALKSGHPCLLHVTHGAHSKFLSQEKLARDLQSKMPVAKLKASKKGFMRDVVSVALENALRLESRGSVQEIYRVEYVGGSLGSTPMVCVGFALNVPGSCTPALISEDRVKGHKG